MTLIWKNPPQMRNRGPQRDWDAVLAELKQHPGQWALVAENVAPSGRDPLRLRGCVVRSTQVGIKPQRVDLYAMWPVEQNGEAS